MKLREWKQVSSGGQQVNTTSSGSSNNSFKKRFNKLIDYYGQHLPKTVSYLDVGLTTKDTLAFSEVYKKGDKVNFNISITDFGDESWIVKIDTDGFQIGTLIGSGWTNLLKKLRAYITVPVVGTPEYTDLLHESLTEWKSVKNNSTTSSAGYEERFEKLIRYHIDHASELESITKKDIEPYGFHLGEHYNTGSQEFDRDVVASADKDTGTLTFSIFVNGARVCQRKCKDYDEFVSELGDSYMYLAPAGTPEYDELLTEWVDSKGNKISLNNSSAPVNTKTSSSLSRKEKFKKILDFHMEAAPPSIDRKEIKFVKDTGFHYMEHVKVSLSHGYDRDLIVGMDSSDNWNLSLFKDGSTLRETSGSGFNELIETLEFYLILPYTNTPEYQELLESSSLAADFKSYENLWD